MPLRVCSSTIHTEDVKQVNGQWLVAATPASSSLSSARPDNEADAGVCITAPTLATAGSRTAAASITGATSASDETAFVGFFLHNH